MLAALFTSVHCIADDVVTFEEFEVNADGYQNDFGDDACFEAGGFTFNCNYFPEWYYWSGFAISSRTETSFTSYTIDQFNLWFYKWVISEKEMIEIAMTEEPKITSKKLLRAALGIK